MTQALARSDYRRYGVVYSPASACLSTGDLRPSRPPRMGQTCRGSRRGLQRYFDHFYPDLYDPEKRAREAKNAGMRYFVVTTNITTASASGTGPHRPSDQHALGRGPHRPDGGGVPRRGHEGRLLPLPHRLAPSRVPGRRAAPRRDDTEYIEANTDRDIARYREYLHGQTRELLTRFGRVDIMWFDFSYSDRVWGGKGKEDWGL